MSRRVTPYWSAAVAVCLLASCQAEPPTQPFDGRAGTTVSATPTKPTAAAVSPATPVAREITLGEGADQTKWLVTECDVEVKEGVLLLKAGEGWVRLDKPYVDFTLSWECRNLKAAEYDSGVHFRAELPKPPAHWPRKFQVNLKTDQEGNLTTVKDATSTGLYKKGEWNTFVLKVVGTTAELEINGKPAWKTDQIDAPSGYIGLQAEVTLGGQFEFRNIKVKAP